jgi:beta-N-acetylhexosaminidase
MLPLVLGLSGLALTPAERALFKEAEPAGFILFGRNIRDRAQLRALTDSLRALTGRADLPILIDQEGGRVSRLGPPEWPDFPSPGRFAALYHLAPISALEAARVHALATALMLREVGVNVNCAPALDLLHAGAHPVIGERALGDSPGQVASLGRMVLEGLAQGGVAGVIKHMPGHGRAPADSHDTLPVVTAGADELEADLAPFRRLAGRARIGMTAHVLYPAWDAQRPATQSPVVIEKVIRGAIGFDGLLLSDDIGMGALQGAIEERALAALAAGIDLVLHCPGDLRDAERLAGAVPPITAGAGGRLAHALPPAPVDPPPLVDLIAKRDALLRLRADARLSAAGG